MKFRSLCLAALGCIAFTSLHAQPGVSGSWYNPAQSGHGLSIDQLSPDSSLMLWFTYDQNGNPMPLYSEGAGGNGVFSGPAYAPHGPRFGDFDPADLVMQPWGRLRFESFGCHAGRLSWEDSPFGAGETPMRPLALLGCDRPASNAPIAGVSGTWYHPQMQGLGLNVQVLDPGFALLYWFAYDALGNPLPLYIEAKIEGHRMKGAALAPRGLRFGSFARGDLQVQPFGNVEVEFQDCDSAMLRYDTPLGKEQFALTRLTLPLEIECALPESRPEWAATLYTGISHEFTFPDFEDAQAILLLNARDEVLLSTTGAQALVRGQLRRQGERSFLQVHAIHDYDKEIQRNPQTGDLFVKFIGPGDPGIGPFEVSLHPSPVQPLPAPDAALPGNYGDPASPYGDRVVVGADLGLKFMRYSEGKLVLQGAGRITRIDAASGVFDFDLRFEASVGSADPAQDPWNGMRIFGSGALLRGADGDRLLLLGEGISQLPKPPALRFIPQRVHALLARTASP